MATANVKPDFLDQIKESREKIRESFAGLQEALRVRENKLLSRVDEIERKYIDKNQETHELVECLNKTTLQCEENLAANKLKSVHQKLRLVMNDKIQELTDDSDISIEFEWNNRFETAIEDLGRIKHETTKLFMPDYKAKQLPVTCCGKKPWGGFWKSPGGIFNPSSLSVCSKNGDVYIAEMDSHRVQVFSSDGDCLFTFNERMNVPRGICVFQNKVFVTQCGSHCINMYELEGKLIKSVGSEGNGEAQFKCPCGLDVSDRNENIYVCDNNNHRVLILTKELKYHSSLGVGSLRYPRDVKVTRDKVFVLDRSDPCMFVYDSDHVLIKRLVSRGYGKQTNNPFCFDVDRNYNIIMSDNGNHCVYVFNQEGEQIHKIGRNGRDVGEFVNPYGIALDREGRIIVVCNKSYNCVQFF